MFGDCQILDSPPLRSQNSSFFHRSSSTLAVDMPISMLADQVPYLGRGGGGLRGGRGIGGRGRRGGRCGGRFGGGRRGDSAMKRGGGGRGGDSAINFCILNCFDDLISYLVHKVLLMNITSFSHSENGTKVEYRIGNPFRPNLAAAIIVGVDNIWIKPGARVLYLGAASGTTVSHVSDLVGPTGVVYAIEFCHRSGRDFRNMAKKRTNVIPIIEDTRHPAKYRMLVSMVDVIFSDIPCWFLIVFLKKLE